MTVDTMGLQAFIDACSNDLYGAEPFTERVFSDEEYAARRSSLQEAMRAAGVEVMIVTAPDTLAWLHGYRSRWYRHHTSRALPPAQCTVLHADDDVMFMIESGYHEQMVRAGSVLQDVRPLPGSDMTHEPGLDDYVRFLVDQFAAEGWQGVGIGLELWSCLPSPAVSRQVEAALESAGHHIVDVTGPVRGLRRLKSPAEIGMIERAQAACDAGLIALRDRLRPGMSELEAWAIFVSGSVAAGGEPAALHETVAAGRLMDCMHRISSRQPLQPGRLFHADAASSYFGYHARGTRPYVFGPAPTELHELASVAAGAREVLREWGTVGTPWRDLMTELQTYYRSTGIEGGAAGYELGLAVPPADWVNEFTWGSDNLDGPGVIEPGLVTNFESWNILSIVDTVVFEEEGPRILSSVPPELMVL